MERTFDKCEALLSDLQFAAVREWKQRSGGRAVGYFPVYAPSEVIRAAGMLPVALSGAGDRLDLQHADARFGSFICSIVKTTLEMGLTGYLEPFDGLLFSTICDSARNLCWVMKRNFPDRYTDFLHLPHNPASPSATDFLTAEYWRLAGELEKLGGRKVTGETLRQAIALYNRNRALLRDLYRLRAQSPHLLRAWEMYALVRAGNLLPVEEHTAMLEQVIAELPRRGGKQRDSVRIVVEGSFCEQPPLDAIKVVEQAGCYVVDDDFGLGRSWFTSDVPLEGDPMRALAASYLDRATYSSVRHDMRQPRWDGLIDKVRRSHADAVLLLVAKFCEPAYFDYVLFKKKLEQAGIPHLLIEFEEKLFTFDRLRAEVETFVESLVFD